MEDVLKGIAIVVAVVFLTLLVIDVFTPAFGFFAKVDSGYVGIQTRFGKIDDISQAKYYSRNGMARHGAVGHPARQTSRGRRYRG